MFGNKIEIPSSMIKKLGWQNNDTILRLTIEDKGFLVIGKTQTHNEIIKSIKDMMTPKYQLPRPIHDAVIQDTLKELIDRTDLLESRMHKMEKRH